MSTTEPKVNETSTDSPSESTADTQHEEYLPELSFEQARFAARPPMVRPRVTRHRKPDQSPLTPPFEAPHHTASTAAIVGGGSAAVIPGAVSRAHHGVLFLDEAGEAVMSIEELDSIASAALNRFGGTAKEASHVAA